MVLLQVFAIELVTFAVDFIPLAVEFVGFAVEFVTLALQFIASAIELDAFAIRLEWLKNKIFKQGIGIAEKSLETRRDRWGGNVNPKSLF